MTEPENQFSSGSSGSTGVGNTKRPPPSKHWVWTWNNYPKGCEIKLNSLLRECGSIGSWIFQAEVGEQGTPHLQGYLCLKTKGRPMGLSMFPKGVHWEKCRSPKHAIEYCRKGQTRIDGPWYGGAIPKPLSVVTYEMLRPWQRQVADMFKEDEDPLFGRVVHWFWEPTGKVGKTVLCKYFVDQCGALVVGGKGADMRCAVVDWVNKNGEGPRMIVMNLPRSVDHVSWEGVENIKDGCFFSGKYESGMCRFNCPWVVCFANVPPPLERLSADRWVVTEIGGEALSIE